MTARPLHRIKKRVALALDPLVASPMLLERLPLSASRRARVIHAKAIMPDRPLEAYETLAPLRPKHADREVWRLSAVARLRLDDHAGVLEVARHARAADHRECAITLLALRAASRVGDQAEIGRWCDQLVECTPPSQAALHDVTRALMRHASDHLAPLLNRLERQQEPGLDLKGLRQAELAVRLSTPAADSQSREATLSALLSDPDSATTVLNHMVDIRRLSPLAALLDNDEVRALAVQDERLSRRLADVAVHTAARGRVHDAAVIARKARDIGGTVPPGLFIECDDQIEVLEGSPVLPRVLSGLPDAAPHLGTADRVLSVLGQSLPLRSGGYATRSHGILTGLRDRGWQMAAVTKLGFPQDFWARGHVATTPDVRSVDVVDGIEYHRLLTPGVTEYPRYPLAEHVHGSALGVERVARAHGASVIHAASLFDVGMAGAVAAQRLGVPFVYEMRGLKQLLEGARYPGFESSERGRYFHAVEMEVAQRADRLLVITRALGALMAEWGVDPSRIRVVPNGVHAGQFRPLARDPDLASRLGVTGRVVIGYVGGLVHYEGLDVLLRAFASIRRTRDDLHLLIVGDGAHEQRLHSLAQRLGLMEDENVTFEGRVPHDQVEDYLSLIDIAPFPRLPSPVTQLISPIKPFEAMAAGISVVVSDVDALTEIVIDGQTGRHAIAGDPDSLALVLTELADDPQARHRLATAGRAWVLAERDWSIITGVVDEVYRELSP